MPTLQALSAQLMGILRRNPHAERVHQDWGAQSFTVDVAIDPDRANRAGLTNADVAVSTAVRLNGLEVTSMYRGDQIVPVVARLRMDERARLGDLHNMYVYSSQGGQKVSLPQIASLSTELRPEQIKRRNQFRTITVQAFPRGGSLPSEVLTYSRKDIDRFAASLPPGFRLQIAGEYEKQQSGFGEMTMVLLISVALIFVALTVQFQNAIKPFIVFGAIPYGFVGAVAGLWVMGSPFGFMGFLGIASLVGVIVSHVIVLFDFIEEAREKGEGLEEALLDAGIQRLRPVLITVGRHAVRPGAAGAARGAALGAALLRPDRRPRDRDGDHPDPRAGVLRDHGQGPQARALGGVTMARSNGAQGHRHRVAIVGGGFGGLFAARALRRVEVEVTVIDRTNHHLFQPLLYQVATGILSEGEIAPPIRDILRRQANARVLLGEVVDIDVARRLLLVDTLDRRTAVPYDSLIVAAGASQSYFGHPEFAVDAPGMKTIDHALELRGGSSAPSRWRSTRATPSRGAAGSRSWWWVLGRRGWSSRGSSQSCRAARCAGTSDTSTRRTRACCCWTQGPRSCPRSRRRSGSAPCATSARSGSRFTWAPPSPT